MSDERCSFQITDLMRPTYLLISNVILCLLLSACGGGGGGRDYAALAALTAANASAGSAGGGSASGTGGSVKPLIAVSAEVPGAHCATGGTRVDAGWDADDNGVLAAGEVGSTQYVCNGATGGTGAAGPAGAAGSNGLSVLVQMRDEPASDARCAAGGKAIDVGTDDNADGRLDAPEIDSTGYICNGTRGADGSPGRAGDTGAAGLNTLMRIVDEPAGTNCVHGGKKIETGLDNNNPPNGQLDASEVTATSYICNGATVDWVNVTGTAVQALANSGYVASNDAAQVVVTLPINPAIGSVVRVSGAGLGGWKIAQNAGQAIRTTNIGGVGAIWTPVTSDARSWSSVASSADGSKLVATVYNGQIYTSQDSGATWMPRATDQRWTSVASSADGSRLVATVQGGQIYVSTNSGETWEPRENNHNWVSVASSADGSRLAAAVQGGQIYISTNGGDTWQPHAFDADWVSVSSSADGSKLVAADAGFPAAAGWIYTSTNGGDDWTWSAAERRWQWVASSADGTKLVAVEQHGRIHTSGDSGATWTPRETDRNWASAAYSADGSKLAAVASDGRIYISTDSGMNWAERESNRSWSSVALSADGSKLVATAFGGLVYTSTSTTTPGLGGSISGTRYDAIELQYVGNGMFTVLSHEGQLTIQ